MAKKLTKKQRGFVKDYLKTGNGTQAAMKNYDVKEPLTAAVIASENLSKPYIAEIVERYADRIPEDVLLKTHLEGLEATTLRFSPEGEPLYVPDHTSRAKFTDMGYKVKGTYAPEKKLTLNVNVEPTPKIRTLADLLNAN